MSVMLWHRWCWKGIIQWSEVLDLYCLCTTKYCLRMWRTWTSRHQHHGGVCNVHCTLCNVGLQQAAVAVVAVPAGYGAEDEASQEDCALLIFQCLSLCWKMFSVVFQSNSKSHLSAAWCLLYNFQTYCFVFYQLTYCRSFCIILFSWSKNLSLSICFGKLSYQRTFCQLKPSQNFGRHFRPVTVSEPSFRTSSELLLYIFVASKYGFDK